MTRPSVRWCSIRVCAPNIRQWCDHGTRVNTVSMGYNTSCNKFLASAGIAYYYCTAKNVRVFTANIVAANYTQVSNVINCSSFCRWTFRKYLLYITCKLQPNGRLSHFRIQWGNKVLWTVLIRMGGHYLMYQLTLKRRWNLNLLTSLYTRASN
jgi:hypothetical protein